MQDIMFFGNFPHGIKKWKIIDRDDPDKQLYAKRLLQKTSLTDILGSNVRRLLPIELDASGRQRERRGVQKTEYDRSIACFEGVLVRSDGWFNSVRFFASDRYPDGVMHIPIELQSLRHGTMHLQKMSNAVTRRDIRIEELLPYGILKRNSREAPSQLFGQQNKTATIDRHRTRLDPDELQRFEQLENKCALTTVNNLNDIHGTTWVIIYNQRSGVVTSLEQSPS